MKKTDKLSLRKTIRQSELQFISRTLSAREKKVVKLLQNKEVLIVTDKKVLVTCGEGTMNISSEPFYNLVNNGLISRQAKSPFKFVLSATGKSIKF